MATKVSLESLEHDKTRKSRPAKPSPNPDNAGPSVLCFMGLPVMASCDIAWDRTRVCSDTSNTAMQFLRLLRHSGGPGPTNTYTYTQTNLKKRNYSDIIILMVKEIWAYLSVTT